MRTDCDQDAIWLKVEHGGAEAACHTGRRSCFYRALPVGAAAAGVLSLLSSTRSGDSTQDRFTVMEVPQENLKEFGVV